MNTSVKDSKETSIHEWGRYIVFSIVASGDLFRLLRLLADRHNALNFSINNETHFLSYSYDLAYKCLVENDCDDECYIYIAYIDSITEYAWIGKVGIPCLTLKKFHQAMELNDFRFPDRYYEKLFEKATDPDRVDPDILVQEFIDVVYEMAGEKKDV